ncbi:ulp1 protease family, C-terminal catalytic domain-containing protein [Tanacetum coccineum]
MLALACFLRAALSSVLKAANGVNKTSEIPSVNRRMETVHPSAIRKHLAKNGKFSQSCRRKESQNLEDYDKAFALKLGHYGTSIMKEQHQREILYFTNALCATFAPLPSNEACTCLDENALQHMVDEETSCRAESLSQVSHDSYQKNRMKILKKRPIEIQLRASLFMKRENPNEAINVESADGMYDQKFMEHVDNKSLIGWMTRDWLDVPIIHWLCIGHWTLLIVDRSMQNGYILDSYNKDEKKKKTPGDFLVVNVLNEACQVNLDWTFLQCNQQKYTWECGYYVMKWILDFVMIIQHEFPDNISKYFTTTKGISMAMLDQLVDCTSKAFYEHHCQPCEESI